MPNSLNLGRFTVDNLAYIVGVSADNPNLQSVALGLQEFGNAKGLNRPHRLVAYLAQISHESMGFVYDREVWGPTEAQKRYEGRKDLGNTQPGDGSKFRGYTTMQITGRYNTNEFMQWCKRTVKDVSVPNFMEEPSLMNTDPWEGLGPIWYWDSRNLNTWADVGDFEKITRIINGGLNGYKDRCNRYTETALRMLGYGPTEVRKFQANHSLVVDGIAGEATRTELHKQLTKLGSITWHYSKPPKNKIPVYPVTGAAKEKANPIVVVATLLAIAAAIYFGITLSN